MSIRKIIRISAHVRYRCMIASLELILAMSGRSLAQDCSNLAARLAHMSEESAEYTIMALNSWSADRRIEACDFNWKSLLISAEKIKMNDACGEGLDADKERFYLEEKLASWITESCTDYYQDKYGVDSAD